MASIYENGQPDARQSDGPGGLFRKRYRQLDAEEIAQHDHIKDKAHELAQAIGALNPVAYARILGVTEAHTGYRMEKTYDGAGVTLALRHLEDAVYRAVKALTA